MLRVTLTNLLVLAFLLATETMRQRMMVKENTFLLSPLKSDRMCAIRITENTESTK